MEIIYFLIASFLVVVVPGPTVSLIIANSLKSGMRAGILNVVGTQLGLIILILLLALGFSLTFESECLVHHFSALAPRTEHVSFP